MSAKAPTVLLMNQAARKLRFRHSNRTIKVSVLLLFRTIDQTLKNKPNFERGFAKLHDKCCTNVMSEGSTELFALWSLRPAIR